MVILAFLKTISVKKADDAGQFHVGDAHTDTCKKLSFVICIYIFKNQSLSYGKRNGCTRYASFEILEE